jgi:hypothetical protein
MPNFNDYLKEEARHQPFFDKLYRDMGLEIIDRKQNKFWDLKLKRDAFIFTVEEKARNRTWDDILIETIQDTKTNSLGWIYYSKADFLVYGMFGDKIYVYRLNMPNFKKWFESHEQFYSEIVSKKGWGETVNKPIPIKHIPNNIIKCIYPR